MKRSVMYLCRATLLMGVAALALLAMGPLAASEQEDVSSVVGRPAPSWELEGWINSSPLSLEQLRGKVVLIRWFASPSCPFCTASAPSFRRLHEAYADKGLVVVGAYHHKDNTPLDRAKVIEHVKTLGFEFPVAIDRDWATLKRWWLDGKDDRRFTSVTFLLDQEGVIRHVHTGGTVDAAAKKELEAKIRALLEP